MIPFRSSCRWLAVGVVCAAVVAVGTGCRAKPVPQGGATSPKAQAARTQAETYAVDAVAAAADANSRAATARRSGGGGILGRGVELAKRTPTVVVTIGVPPAEPPALPPTVSVPPTGPVMGPVPPAAPVTGPKVSSQPTRNVVIKERIAIEVPQPTETKADEEALKLAQERVKARLAELDPPVHFTPSLIVVRNEYLRQDTRTVRQPGPAEREALERADYTGEHYYVEYDVEVTAEQVRELRTQERLGGAVRCFAGLAGLALAGFLFLRLDEWTKGYLTSWLAFAAAALAGGVAAAVLLV